MRPRKAKATKVTIIMCEEGQRRARHGDLENTEYGDGEENENDADDNDIDGKNGRKEDTCREGRRDEEDKQDGLRQVMVWRTRRFLGN